jgi:hypothetical protein
VDPYEKTRVGIRANAAAKHVTRNCSRKNEDRIYLISTRAYRSSVFVPTSVTPVFSVSKKIGKKRAILVAAVNLGA